jgi:acetylornithine aminotransferase
MNDTLMNTYNRLPVAFSRGAGAWLFGENNEKYLDALSGISVCNLGHANPAVTAALADQAGKLLHTSNLYEIPLQRKLAGKLCAIAGLDKVFFGNSGAEANEAAIKICRKFAWQNEIREPLIVVMEGSFHGRTIATLSATGNDKIRVGFDPLLPGFIRVPYGDIDALSALAEKYSGIVAVMLEPVQGEGGIVIPPSGYLAAVRHLCTRHRWLMVLDEIQSGMGRTGEWFAWQHEQAKPDVMTLAKALGNGVPVGACLASGEAAGIFAPGNHGSTFGGNPLASRTGIAVIEYILEHDLLSRARQLGTYMLSRFEDILGDTSGITDIRGMGLMMAIELEEDCGALVNMALEQRLLVNVTAGNVIRLLPPLIITDAEADLIINGVTTVINKFLSTQV